MKAITIHEFGGPEELLYEEMPVPEFGPGEILVKVHATAINPVDWKIREGYISIILLLWAAVLSGNNLASNQTIVDGHSCGLAFVV